MADIYTAKSESLTAVADVIRKKTGKSDLLKWPDEYVSGIESIQAGSAEKVERKDVNFFDYDGTLLYSYTAAEAAAMTELPAGPTHDGLVFQGWNWTLDQIQKYGAADVGATYITDDGKTRFYVHFESDLQTSAQLYIAPSVFDGVTIDWGDGITEKTTSTAATKYTHTYSATGDYVITLEVTDGTATLGGGDTVTEAYGGTSDSNRLDLLAIEIGARVTALAAYAFSGCSALSHITIPQGCTNLGSTCFGSIDALHFCVLPAGVDLGGSAFMGNNLLSVSLPGSLTMLPKSLFSACGALDNVIIPGGVTSLELSTFYKAAALQYADIPADVTSIGSSAFEGCTILRRVTIPDGVIAIAARAFASCKALIQVTIPESITSIDSYAFYFCTCAQEYHLLPTTPPTLAATSAFNSIPSDCIIYVPAGCLEAYQSATNWATYADYMQEEPTT